MATFVQQNSTSHHYYAACEVVGDLLVEAGLYANAETYYAQVAKAPWEDYQLRAKRLTGQALLAQARYPEALAAFDQVEKSTASDPDSRHQKTLARVGTATALAETNKAAEAVQILQKLIQDVDETQLEYFALAYNALGRCHRKAGQPQDAILAYLHVDILAGQLPGPHAEALANLVALWKEVGDQDRAAQDEARLKQLYPASRWAKQEIR
jgi:tetratricopeptide (TPR) repeat protein